MATDTVKYKIGNLPQKSGTHRIILYPGKHYVVKYTNAHSLHNWLTDAEYVGVQTGMETLVVFKVLNGSQRRIKVERIVDVYRLAEPLEPGQRQQIIDRMQEIRAERHPETQTDEYREQQRQRVQAWLEDRRQTQALIEEIAARHVTEMRAARKAGYRVVKHADS